MRFLKSKTLSKYSPSDQTLFSNSAGRAVMSGHGAIRLPKGTTAQRPDLTGVRVLGGAYGYIRYNTDLNAIEAYVGDGTYSSWEIVREAATETVTRQKIETADGIETSFGPLNVIPADAKNIVVYVENVFQHASENYNIDTSTYPGEAWIAFTSPVPIGKPIWIYYGFSN
jgi:hypothetical protein